MQPARNQVYFTITSRNRLGEALVVANSAHQHDPHVAYWIFTSDFDAPEKLRDSFPFITFRAINFIDQVAVDSMRTRYGELEFLYALTPYSFKYLLTLEYSSALFLKLETLVLDSLEPIINELDEYSVVTTPHLLKPGSTNQELQREIEVLGAGIFNGGVLGFSNSTESLRFLDWWSEKTRIECARDTVNGLHFEQRWLNFLPSYIERLRIIENLGVNVAHWNIHERDLSLRDGSLFAGAEPCRVVRFSGFENSSPNLLSRYRPDLKSGALGAVDFAFAKYRAELSRFTSMISGIE